MSDILTHAENGVMTITFNRLERKNSITAAMYGALADALAQAGSDPAIRVVVLQGHETVFSAGNDIGDFLNKPPAGQDSPVFRFLRGIATFPKPLLAAVCGPAVGVGTTMLFHCDLVYAGDNAAFSMPFVNLGLCPEAASSLLVPQMLGYHRAAEALLLGEPFMAEAALEVGLVNRVLPPTEANAYAQAVAQILDERGGRKREWSVLSPDKVPAAAQWEADNGKDREPFRRGLRRECVPGQHCQPEPLDHVLGGPQVDRLVARAQHRPHHADLAWRDGEHAHVAGAAGAVGDHPLHVGLGVSGWDAAVDLPAGRQRVRGGDRVPRGPRGRPPRPRRCGRSRGARPRTGRTAPPPCW